MTTTTGRRLSVLALLLLATACSRGAPTATAPAAPGVAPAATVTERADAAAPDGPADAAPVGYSCTFPGAGGRSTLARFVVSGMNAHDDQGLPFQVLANSATAVVLAHARDDVTAPSGDIGAYVVAIDRRDLSMVQSTVGVNGAGVTRRGRCIVG